MIVCRDKITNKLEQVYAGYFEMLESPDKQHYLSYCNIFDKYPCDLNEEEYSRAKANRII